MLAKIWDGIMSHSTEWAHLWVMIPLVLVMIAIARKRRRFPSTKEIISLFGYGGSLYGSVSILNRAFHMKVSDEGGVAWTLFLAGALAGLTSTKGLWKLFNKMTKKGPQPVARQDEQTAAVDKVSNG